MAEARPIFRTRLRPGAAPQQPIDQGVEFESAVDSILGLSQVACAVLLENMDCRFDVGDEGVHPLEQTDLAGLARADDDRSVFGHTGPGGIEAGTHR